MPKNSQRSIVYFCPKCRRGFQFGATTMTKNCMEYYGSHIKGDVDRICPECEEKEKSKNDQIQD